MSNSDNSSMAKSSTNPPMEKLVIGGATYTTRLTYKFKNRKAWSRPDERKLNAVIPGAIKKIMVKEGDKVTQGIPLLILEAMKMENLVLSHMEGVIRKIYIAEGDQVSKSQLLLEFE